MANSGNATLRLIAGLARKIISNGRILIGSQQLRIEQEPGAKVVRCQHWNGNVSILLVPPAKGKLLNVLLHCPA